MKHGLRLGVVPDQSYAFTGLRGRGTTREAMAAETHKPRKLD